MIKFFASKKLKAFGLDISDTSIITMQLDPKRGGYFPTAYSNISIAPNIIANHMITKPDKLAEAVKKAVLTAKHLDTKYVVASVPEAKSFVRILKMPLMKESEIEGAVPYELEQDIPVPIDQVYLDWQIIGQDKENMDVLVMATPRDYVDSLVDVLRMAGLKPVALELESQATGRALISKADASESVLVLDMSVMQTSFMIMVSGGVLEYTSSIPIGGNAFTDSIASSLGVSTAEAEKIKRESGLLAENKKGNVRQAMLPVLDNIVDEIKKVTRYYEEHSGGKSIGKIYLCGGTAKLSGLVDYVSAPKFKRAET